MNGIYHGIIMSDWGACNDRSLSIKAGLDLEMPGSHGAYNQHSLPLLNDSDGIIMTTILLAKCAVLLSIRSFYLLKKIPKNLLLKYITNSIFMSSNPSIVPFNPSASNRIAACLIPIQAVARPTLTLR